jgi:hypothetical protein
MCESKRWTQQFYHNNVDFIATGTIVSSPDRQMPGSEPLFRFGSVGECVFVLFIQASLMKNGK